MYPIEVEEIVPASRETPKALKTLILLTFLDLFFKICTSKLHTHRPNIDPISAQNPSKNYPKSTPKRSKIEPKSASWGGPGEKCDLGGLLGGSWGVPGGSLGRPWGSLGAPWGVFGGSRGRLGRSLEPPGGVLGPPRALLGRLWGHRGVHFEVIWRLILRSPSRSVFGSCFQSILEPFGKPS